MIAAIDLVFRPAARYLTILIRMDQSLRGHDGSVSFRQTSHGIVLGSSTNRSEFTVISRNFR